MFSPYQGTLERKVKFAGVGLHTGVVVNVEVAPASANTGIIFQRIDNPDASPTLAHPFNVSSTDLCTAIGSGPSRISTIEHLMAAFAGLGIDNALVTVDSCEIPILDGSAAPFVDQFNIAGVKQLPFFRKLLMVKRVVEIKKGDQSIKIEPSDSFELNCNIEFTNSSAIGKQSLNVGICEKDSFSEICDARTFCHIDDVNAMRKAGLAKGGSFDNAVVVNSDSVLNTNGLRYADEFVRHKMLDCMGDLFLLGGKLLGKVTTNKAGHALHTELAALLIREQSRCLEVIDQGKVDVEVEKKNHHENGIEGLGLVANMATFPS